MSYICTITGKVSRQGNATKDPPVKAEKLNKLVVATREKVYTKKVKNEETNKWEDVEIGRGFETVKEINVSEEGLKLWDSWSDEERQMFLQQL